MIVMCAKVEVRVKKKKEIKNERKGKSLKVFPGHRCSVLCSASSRGSKEAKTLKMRYELSRICRAAFRSVSAHSADGRHYSCQCRLYCRRTGCRAEVSAVWLRLQEKTVSSGSSFKPFVFFSLLTPAVHLNSCCPR